MSRRSMDYGERNKQTIPMNSEGLKRQATHAATSADSRSGSEGFIRVRGGSEPKPQKAPQKKFASAATKLARVLRAEQWRKIRAEQTND